MGNSCWRGKSVGPAERRLPTPARSWERRERADPNSATAQSTEARMQGSWRPARRRLARGRLPNKHLGVLRFLKFLGYYESCELSEVYSACAHGRPAPGLRAATTAVFSFYPVFVPLGGLEPRPPPTRFQKPEKPEKLLKFLKFLKFQKFLKSPEFLKERGGGF